MQAEQCPTIDPAPRSTPLSTEGLASQTLILFVPIKLGLIIRVTVDQLSIVGIKRKKKRKEEKRYLTITGTSKVS